MECTLSSARSRARLGPCCCWDPLSAMLGCRSARESQRSNAKSEDLAESRRRCGSRVSGATSQCRLCGNAARSHAKIQTGNLSSTDDLGDGEADWEGSLGERGGE